MVKFNDTFEKIESMDRLYIGERIRDIIYDEEINGFLIAMENTSSIGYVRLKKLETHRLIQKFFYQLFS